MSDGMNDGSVNTDNPNSGGSVDENIQNNDKPTTYTMEDFRNTQWREAIVDENNKTHASMANFKSIDDLAKSYINAQKMIGADKVLIPKADDKEGWDGVYNKLGRPENIDGYEFELPEDVPPQWKTDAFKQYQNDFKQIAYENGLSKVQAEQQWKFIQNKALQNVKGQQEAGIKEINRQISVLKEEYGSKLPEVINKRDALLNKFGGEEALAFVKNNPILNSSPVVIKMFDEIAKNFGEDIITDNTIKEAGAVTPSEAKSKINQILADKEHPYRNRNHPDHDDAVKEFRRLMKYSKGGK